MTNKKIKNARFNLIMEEIVTENWRFLAGILLVLERRYGWRRKRLEGWVSSAVEYVNIFNDYDRDGDYRYRLKKLEEQSGGGIITYEKVNELVCRRTSLINPAHVSEIVDNVEIMLLMTVREYDGVGRQNLIAGYDHLTREDISSAPDHMKKEYGIELETGFEDYKSIVRERSGGKEKPTFKEQKQALAALEGFRRWSRENNPGVG